ncbi:MAG: hypothetical protein IPM34_00875 [Saprospiraceae bacterium]|nr:hypothetical protein [Saprospiraceae bacterium]
MIQAIPIGEHSFIVSDLHLAEGDLDRGLTLGTENFFSDSAFSEMLSYLHITFNNTGQTPLCLIINGDFVDFIRITKVPGDKELNLWQTEIQKAHPGFKLPNSCISEKEKRYGLKTNNYKCIWKLSCVQKGHPGFFSALAAWICQGNQLIINVGNHDPEWYWTLLQNYFRISLWEISGSKENDRQKFENHIAFSIKAFSIYEKVWIDHGHNYEKQTEMDPEYEYHKVAPRRKIMFKKPEAPKEEHEKELFIPFGSFFNRYLINKVELDFPHVDNLTVKGSMLQALIDENFSKVYKTLLNFGGYAILVVQKNFQLSLIRVLSWLVFVVLPIVLFVLLYLKPPTDFFELTKEWNGTLKKGVDWILNFLLPIISRQLIRQVFLWLGLADPPLHVSAFKDLSAGGKLSEYDYIIIGHNHHPQHIIQNGKQYLNTGTWTSKYVQKYERIETGVNYTLVQVKRNADSNVEAGIKQWDNINKKVVTYSNFISNHG